MTSKIRMKRLFDYEGYVKFLLGCKDFQPDNPLGLRRKDVYSRIESVIESYKSNDMTTFGFGKISETATSMASDEICKELNI